MTSEETAGALAATCAKGRGHAIIVTLAAGSGGDPINLGLFWRTHFEVGKALLKVADLALRGIAALA